MIQQLTSLSWEPFVLSFKLAFVTTFILFVITLPLAWVMSQSRRAWRPFVEALGTLPLVLPPSVLGFYLLVAFAPDAWLGAWLQETFGIRLLFSFGGLVVASVIYSFPFMLQPLQSGFESLDKHMIEASYVAGKNRWQTLRYIALPNIKPALLSALVITFAHTVGEFGVVLMVGGSVPHETKVASVAIYEMVEVMDYAHAHLYAGVMLSLSFAVLLTVQFFGHRSRLQKGR